MPDTQKDKTDKGERFREAKILAEQRAGEEKFGPVWADTKLDIIFAKLLEADSATERQVLAGELLEEIKREKHFLDDFPQFDGITQDILNLYVTDPERARELQNELQLKLKKSLQNALTRQFTPSLTPR